MIETIDHTTTGDLTKPIRRTKLFLAPLSEEYPDFLEWYDALFEDSRPKPDRVLHIASDGGDVVGVAIAKLSEQKVCTLRVRPDMQGKGIGTRLLDKAIETFERHPTPDMDPTKPLITVNERLMPQFEKLFERFGFETAQMLPDRYVCGETEIAMNRKLEETRPRPRKHQNRQRPPHTRHTQRRDPAGD